MKANLRKTPVAADVDLHYIAKLTEGLSGADIAELSQRASKAAIREAIEAEARITAAKELGDEGIELPEDPVPELARPHFEEALKYARKSIDVSVSFIYF